MPTQGKNYLLSYHWFRQGWGQSSQTWKSHIVVVLNGQNQQEKQHLSPKYERSRASGAAGPQGSHHGARLRRKQGCSLSSTRALARGRVRLSFTQSSQPGKWTTYTKPRPEPQPETVMWCLVWLFIKQHIKVENCFLRSKELGWWIDK